MGRIRGSGEKVWILSSDGFVVEALGIKEYASGYIVDVCSGSGCFCDIDGCIHSFESRLSVLSYFVQSW